MKPWSAQQELSLNRIVAQHTPSVEDSPLNTSKKRGEKEKRKMYNSLHRRTTLVRLDLLVLQGDDLRRPRKRQQTLGSRMTGY